MKSIKRIAITVVVLAVCLLGYRAVRNTDHDNHKHDPVESSAAVHDHDEPQGHKSNESPDMHQHEERVIELTADEIREIGLETAPASPGTVDTHMSLPGEIRINQDRMAHIAPRVEGVVTKICKTLGDTVQADEVIAVIESRELADSKAGFLAAVERCEMAEIAFQREEKLWKDKISSEQEYLEKKQTLTEAGIEKRAAEQKLHAIGFDASYLQKLTREPEQILTRFELKAPFEGDIIEKHIVLGERVGPESVVYVVADLRSVWVDLHVYPKDLTYITTGQHVVISAASEIPDAHGIITYVGPVVGTQSRTALARVVLANPSGVYRPGLFVTAKAAVSGTPANVVVPKEAIQSLEGKKCVFIKDEHGFEPAFVEIGHENATQVEILSGLDAGREVVTKGAFTLKSKMITSTLGSHAGHGH